MSSRSVSVCCGVHRTGFGFAAVRCDVKYICKHLALLLPVVSSEAETLRGLRKKCEVEKCEPTSLFTRLSHVTVVEIIVRFDFGFLSGTKMWRLFYRLYNADFCVVVFSYTRNGSETQRWQ